MANNDDKRNEKGQYSRGNSGRKKGARNRLHADFIVALEKHWNEVGNAAIDIVFKESPRDYLKIMVSVFPKEFVLEDGRLESMSDDELDGYLDEIRRLKSGEDRGRIIDGTAAASDRKQSRVLSALPKATGLP
jgi:hypothetical protein